MNHLLSYGFTFPTVRPDCKPFSWRLDGGGRNLIFSMLAEHDIVTMLEIGVLYGGSSLQWLQYKRDLTVVGVDPWEFDEDQVRYWWSNREAYGLSNLDQAGLSDEQFLTQLLQTDAAYNCTISNLWDYRDRFVPVRGRSPEILYSLRDCGLSPELVYLDSDKELVDLWICHELWPDALLTGDDWTWTPPDQPDFYPVQIAVEKFASQKNMLVQHSDATWCLLPERGRAR